MAFGEDLLFRVGGKILGCLSLDGDDYFALKCDPEYAIELRGTYEEISGAYHWNKKILEPSTALRLFARRADTFIYTPQLF